MRKKTPGIMSSCSQSALCNASIMHGRHFVQPALQSSCSVCTNTVHKSINQLDHCLVPAVTHIDLCPSHSAYDSYQTKSWSALTKCCYTSLCMYNVQNPTTCSSRMTVFFGGGVGSICLPANDVISK